MQKFSNLLYCLPNRYKSLHFSQLLLMKKQENENNVYTGPEYNISRTSDDRAPGSVQYVFIYLLSLARCSQFIELIGVH